jgi:hypothetical protein
MALKCLGLPEVDAWRDCCLRRPTECCDIALHLPSAWRPTPGSVSIQRSPGRLSGDPYVAACRRSRAPLARQPLTPEVRSQCVLSRQEGDDTQRGDGLLDTRPPEAVWLSASDW